MLSRSIILFFLIFSVFKAESQITFQRIFGEGTMCPYGSADPSGSYICTVDSNGAINHKLNGYGNTIWKKQIPLNGITPSSITHDPNGDYIFSGTIINAGVANALIVRLDSAGDTISYKTYPPLASGNYGTLALPAVDNNYVFAVYENGPLSSSSSTLYKLDIGYNTLWTSNSGSSGITSSGLFQDTDSNFIYTHYDQAGLQSVNIEQINNNGISLHSKTLTDISSCACFSSKCVMETKGGEYIIGTEFQQQTVLIKLDQNFDTVWVKQLAWGNNTPVSLARDRNNGAFLLLNFEGRACMYHMDGNGDSLTLYKFNPMFTTTGSKMERCPDGGYVIAGTTYDYHNVSHGFFIKVDSIGRYTPQGHITASGPTIFCNGDSVTLTGPNGNFHFQWSTGDTTQSITTDTTGTFYLTITANTGTSSTLNPVNVFVSNPGIPQITSQINYLQASTVGSYQWYLNGVAIHNANHDTLVTTQTGNFNVVVTDSVGCIRVSPLFYYSWTEINEHELSHINIFPVPASTVLNFDKNISENEFTIIDIENRLVKTIDNLSGENYQIEINSLENGIYFLKSKKGNISGKFIVMH